MPCEDPSAAPVSATRSGSRATALHLGGLFDQVGESERRALRRIARRQFILSGDQLICSTAGDAIVGDLTCGVLEVVRSDGNGAQSVGLVFPGEIVGDPFGLPANAAVRALTDAQLCTFPRSALEQVSLDYPVVQRALLRCALYSLAEARRWLLVIGRQSARERVVAFLLEFARRQRVGALSGDTLDLPLRRGSIGDLLGLSIETISRQLQGLAQAGLIALPSRRTIQFVDRPALDRLVGARRSTIEGVMP
jgi:CRP/FNR family transcriptional regulator